MDNGIQMEMVLQELDKVMEMNREGKGKGRAKHSEDIVIKDGSNNCESFRKIYEDLSENEDEDESPVVAAPATKKQAALCLAAKPAGKQSRTAKTPLRSASPNDNRPLGKVMVIH